MKEINTIIIGASAAGLASAACLKRANIPYILLEQHQHVAHAWRNHYDRLHLHTPKSGSDLPYMKMPAHYSHYPSRQQVVDYMENYAKELDLQPQFGQKVTAVQRENGHWLTSTETETYTSQNVIIATGETNKPHLPKWQGQDSFQGTIIHSSQYKNGKPYQGKKVLVVGFGNSACEIALDLCEHGAIPSMAVRTPVNVIPRDLFGIPILQIGILLGVFSPKIADMIGYPLTRLIIGDITKYGLKKQPYGPIEQIHKDKQIPLLDIGTMKMIREGKIKVFAAGLDRFEGNTVYFTDGKQAKFDDIVLGTGYRPALNEFLHDAEAALNENGEPKISGHPSGVEGLYFCGFYTSPTGMLREIKIESQQIADYIAG